MIKQCRYHGLHKPIYRVSAKNRITSYHRWLSTKLWYLQCFTTKDIAWTDSDFYVDCSHDCKFQWNSNKNTNRKCIWKYCQLVILFRHQCFNLSSIFFSFPCCCMFLHHFMKHQGVSECSVCYWLKLSNSYIISTLFTIIWLFWGLGIYNRVLL